MKTNTIKNLLTAAAVMTAVAASAQTTSTGYFNQEYTYRFEMNPAFANSRGFVGMPGIGNVNVAMNGNLGMDKVLFNVDGRTTTFLNPKVSTAEVMDGLTHYRNRVGADFKVNVINVGFKGMGGYNTISINARGNVDARVPRTIFSLLKEGVSNREYDIEDVSAKANAFAEVALGHQHNINGEWSVGGRLKFLVGAGNVDARLTTARLTLGQDDWTVVSNGTVNTSLHGMTYKTKVNKHTGHRYVSGADIDKAGVGGYGMAIDLGVEWKPQAWKNWRLSFAVLDMGFIAWKNNMTATTDGDRTFNLDRYTFNVDGDATNSFTNEWHLLRDNFTQIYELEDKGDLGSRVTGIAATINSGVEYTLPSYRKLTFGLLNTTRIYGSFTHTDFRLSANIAPVKALSGSVSFGAGTFGASFGCLVNVHCPGFNLFAGMDHVPHKLNKQYIPLSSNAQVNVGMNFLF